MTTKQSEQPRKRLPVEWLSFYLNENTQYINWKYVKNFFLWQLNTFFPS